MECLTTNLHTIQMSNLTKILMDSHRLNIRKEFHRNDFAVPKM